MTDKSKVVGEWEAVPNGEWEAVPQNTNDIPKKVTGVYIAPQEPTLSRKVAQIISGGKFGSMQDLLYGGETPESTNFGKAMQILNQSGIEGLSGIAPVGQLESALTQVGSNIPSILPYAKNLLDPAKQIAKEAAQSDFIKGLNIAKYGSPSVKEAWSAGKKQGLPQGTEKSSGVENWLKSMFGNKANVNEVQAAKDMSTGYKDVLAAQQKTEKATNLFPRYNMQLPSNEPIMLPKSILESKKGMTLEEATRAGQEATWLPSKPIKYLDLAAGAFHPASIPFLSLTSPRVQANLGYMTGAGINLAKKAGKAATTVNNMLPEASLEDLFKYGLLSPYMATNQGLLNIQGQQ